MQEETKEWREEGKKDIGSEINVPHKEGNKEGREETEGRKEETKS